jgi:hypothetical protein
MRIASPSLITFFKIDAVIIFGRGGWALSSSSIWFSRLLLLDVSEVQIFCSVLRFEPNSVDVSIPCHVCTVGDTVGSFLLMNQAGDYKVLL